jgi:hypothetical protein
MEYTEVQLGVWDFTYFAALKARGGRIDCD